MRIAAVGIGGAGSRIVDALWRDDQRRRATYLGGACAVDTDTAALAELDALPSGKRHAFGNFETEGAGTDGDRATGVAAIEADRLEVRRAIDPLVTSDVDAVVLVAGLAGGTGGGAAPHVADALGEIYERPLYSVSVLPAGWDETAARNAVRSLQTLGSAVDGQVLFDNEAWLGSGQTVEAAAGTLNEPLVTRLGALFAAGEADTSGSVGQSVVDASEVINTLSGYATLGYASQELEPAEGEADGTVLDRLRSRLFGEEPVEVDEISAHKAVETTLRRAVRGKLTAECTRDSASRALSVFAGPPQWLMRDAVSEGRQWLESELQSPEIRSGDTPTPDRAAISTLVLFGGVTAVPRIAELETLCEEG